MAGAIITLILHTRNWGSRRMTCLQKNTQEEQVVVLGLHPGSLALHWLLVVILSLK